MKVRAFLPVLLLSAGCAGVPQTVEVAVPVPFPCIDQRPQAPKFLTPDELQAMDDYHLTLALASEMIKARVYALRLEAALAGCD